MQTKSFMTSCLYKRSNLFSLGEIKQPLYAQQYPTVLVKPNGSTIRINYHEPIAIINLPFDVSTLEEQERKRRIMKVCLAGLKSKNKMQKILNNFAYYIFSFSKNSVPNIKTLYKRYIGVTATIPKIFLWNYSKKMWI